MWIDTGKLTTEMILHVLRNPWGHSMELRRQARLDAAYEIEHLQKMLIGANDVRRQERFKRK